ncbi:MAG: hypothetical protein JWP12_3520 [Bacteroidetes bacterium]|nr:hypothetical protein [Bacteroidota bacterium]
MKKNLLKKAAIVGFIFVAFMTTTASAFTAVSSGNWSSATTWGGVAPGATVSNQDIVIPSGLTVTFDTDVNFSGLLNSFTVNGTLSSSSSNSLTIAQGTFAGAGTVTINRIRFTGLLATMSYTGNMTVHHFDNTASILSIASSVSVTDTLDLDGGSITLAAGANLAMMMNGTILVNAGTLAISGGVFNASNNYNVVYIGASKTSGVEINSTHLNDLIVSLNDNTQSVTLGGSMTVNGVAHVNAGMLNFNGQHLTINSDLIIAAGAMLTSNTTSDLTINGNSSIANGLVFSSGSAMSDFEINHSGSVNVKLMSALNIAGNLTLTNGGLALETGSILTMNAASTVRIGSGSIVANGGGFVGTAAYNVDYMGAAASTGLEVSGSGLNDVSLHLTTATDRVSLTSDVAMSGALDMQSGQLQISGYKLTVNGTLNSNSNSVFVGNSSAELILNLSASVNDTLYFNTGAGNDILSKLTVNAGTASTVYLGTELQIGTELVLTSGKLDLGESNLMLQSAATITGYSSTRYIVTSGNGKLQIHINTSAPYVIFPVGTTTGYSPAAIQQTGAGTAGEFMVSAMPGVYSNGTTGWNSAVHNGRVVNRTWQIIPSGGMVVNSNLKLGWATSDEVNGFDRTNSYIAGYNTSWDTAPFTAAVAGTMNGNDYETERMAVTSASGNDYAVADSSASITLGIDENQTEVTILLYPNPSTDVINVQTDHAADTYQYEIIDITGKTLNAATNKNTVNTFDVKNLSKGYYFIKATNLTNKQVITKRFIKS